MQSDGSAAGLLLHPVRLRIVQAFLGGRDLTTADLRRELPEVAPATLYRQVNTLLDGGLLEVADERRVRGAVERTLRLRADRASVDAAEAATMTREEHRSGFLTFAAALIADFDRYLDRDDIDLGRDLVGYRQTALNLSDEEMLDFLRRYGELLGSVIGRPLTADRTRRLFTTVVVPDDRG